MLPLPIYRCPETVTPRQTTAMGEIVNKEFTLLTGRANKMPRTNAPVVCVSTAGIHGFWSLESNDPDMDDNILRTLVANIAKWEGSPADPNAI